MIFKPPIELNVHEKFLVFIIFLILFISPIFFPGDCNFLAKIFFFVAGMWGVSFLAALIYTIIEPLLNRFLAPAESDIWGIYTLIIIFAYFAEFYYTRGGVSGTLCGFV